MKLKAKALQKQYETFPYPPVNRLALPRRDQGITLRYELGTSLAWGKLKAHDGIRILVAGAGTLEALVVAQRHPRAQEIVAVDFSRNSLVILKQRYRFAQFARFLSRHPKLTLVHRNLLEDLGDLGKFDYILASNLLQHVSTPVALLKNLQGMLQPEGLLRLITYPKASRIWMRAASRWLRSGGLDAHTPGLVKKARTRIRELAETDPIRLNFEIHPEVRHPSGLVDAFFNALESPLSPLQLEQALNLAGLQCVAESQSETSRSEFLDEITPELMALSRWQKLQILDDLLELCANPVLWLTRQPPVAQLEPPESEQEQTPEIAIQEEMAENLRRIQKLIKPQGVTLSKLFSDFQTKVGPRVHPSNPSRALVGLALSDYPLDLLKADGTPQLAGLEAGLEEVAGAAGAEEGLASPELSLPV